MKLLIMFYSTVMFSCGGDSISNSSNYASNSEIVVKKMKTYYQMLSDSCGECSKHTFIDPSEYSDVLDTLFGSTDINTETKYAFIKIFEWQGYEKSATIVLYFGDRNKIYSISASCVFLTSPSGNEMYNYTLGKVIKRTEIPSGFEEAYDCEVCSLKRACEPEVLLQFDGITWKMKAHCP